MVLILMQLYILVFLSSYKLRTLTLKTLGGNGIEYHKYVIYVVNINETSELK